MSLLNPASCRRSAVLALVLCAAFAGSAPAAVHDLTLDDKAQLSPGQLHATLTGTITCDPGEYRFVSGQVAQGSTSGFGSTQLECTGAPQPISIDVSSGPFGGAAFRPGRASAQLSTSDCGPLPPYCSTRYVDDRIRLVK